MRLFLLVGSHPLTRSDLRFRLEGIGHYVIDGAETVQDTFLMVNKYKPDFLIVDLDTKSLDGLELIASIRLQDVMIPIITLSSRNPIFYAKKSFKAGASGFINKKNGLSLISTAIKAIDRGVSYFPLELKRNDSPNNELSLNTLSPREFEFLQYLSNGMTTQEIAQHMKIVVKSVSTFKRRMMSKLDIKTNSELNQYIKINKTSLR